jgi:hypothetical protein
MSKANLPSSVTVVSASSANVLPSLYAPAPSGDITGTTDSANLAVLLATPGPIQEIRLQAGIYYVKGLIIDSYRRIRGQGRGSTIIQLPAGANTFIFQTRGFSGYTGTSSISSTPGSFGLYDLDLNGNGVNQTATAIPLMIYGASYTLEGIEIYNGYGGNMYTEWGYGGIDMESFVHNCKFHDNVYDTTKIARSDTATVTSGSAMVFDASITVSDQGKLVTGTGIPTGVYIGTVTAGTSFLLSSSSQTQTNVNATATGNSVSISPLLTGGCNVVNYGPHDAQWTNVIMYHAGSSTNPTQNYYGGIKTGSGSQGADGVILTACHAFGWGTVGMQFDAPHIWNGCESEGHSRQVVIGSYGNTITGGQIFGANTTGQTGLGFTNNAERLTMTGTYLFNFGSGSFLFDFTGSGTGSGGQHHIDATTTLGSATINGPGLYFSPTDRFTVHVLDAPTNNTTSDPGGATYRGASGMSAQKFLGYTSSFGTQTCIVSGTTGAIAPGGTAGIGARMYSGSGVPSTPGGVTTYYLGDLYFRTDTPTATSQRIYIVTTGGSSPTWTALL